jgi:hypothetical protein
VIIWLIIQILAYQSGNDADVLAVLNALPEGRDKQQRVASFHYKKGNNLKSTFNQFPFLAILEKDDEAIEKAISMFPEGGAKSNMLSKLVIKKGNTFK